MTTPLGVFQSADHEDQSFTLSGMCAQIGKTASSGQCLHLVTGGDTFITIGPDLLRQSVVTVTGCSPAAVKPNFTVVE